MRYVAWPIACPACGCPSWTGMVSWMPDPVGDDLECNECGLWIWEGQIAAPGRAMDQAEVERDVAALARARFGLQVPDPVRLYVPPEDRPLGLALVDVRSGAGPSSITIRFPRRPLTPGPRGDAVAGAGTSARPRGWGRR